VPQEKGRTGEGLCLSRGAVFKRGYCLPQLPCRATSNNTGGPAGQLYGALWGGWSGALSAEQLLLSNVGFNVTIILQPTRGDIGPCFTSNKHPACRLLQNLGWQHHHAAGGRSWSVTEHRINGCNSLAGVPWSPRCCLWLSGCCLSSPSLGTSGCDVLLPLCADGPFSWSPRSVARRIRPALH
jgi:hypothetical protein